ncbi:complement factor H-related protein 3-like [Leptosomus discolor]
MTLLSHSIVFLLWMGCTTCKASAGAACEDPPLIDFGEIVSGHKSRYEESDSVQYRCNPGYTLSGSEWVICHENVWVPSPPQCLAPCKVTKDQLKAQNLLLSNGQRQTLLIQSGQWHKFMCMTGFQLTAFPIKQCFNGHIELPSCINEIVCSPPRVPNGNFSPLEDSYSVGAVITVQCNPGYHFKALTGKSTAECTNNGWVPDPSCVRKSRKCGPPPVIENGDLLTFPMQEYPQHTTLEYKCPNLYVMEGSRYITCTNGQWSSPPVCLAACTASEEDMGRNNIELKWVAKTKLYSRSDDFIEFQCKRGYMEDPASPPFRVQCVEGTFEYPHCKPGKNCTVLGSTMERNNIRLRSSSRTSTGTYSTGDYILFECKWWYHQDSHPEKFRATCMDGEIEYPRCA